MATVRLLSMTGFGRAQAETEIGKISVEVRSVNNRFLDLRFRLPREWAALENSLRAQAKQILHRGKVDVFVRWEASPDALPKPHLNRALLENFYRELCDAQKALGHPEPPSWEVLLQLPGVMQPEGDALEEVKILELASGVLRDAIESLQAQRAAEGNTLRQDLMARAEVIEEAVNGIEQESPQLVEKFRERLRKRIEELQLAQNLDPGRLEAETAMFADKSDITEEIVRFRHHLQSYRDILTKPDTPTPGRSLDFLMQELLREANTIASKGRDTTIAQHVLVIKNELEKIREQVQNLE
ncbi:MAG: YicC/YloC family endoribonuclease [bacterium]